VCRFWGHHARPDPPTNSSSKPGQKNRNAQGEQRMLTEGHDNSLFASCVPRVAARLSRIVVFHLLPNQADQTARRVCPRFECLLVAQVSESNVHDVRVRSRCHITIGASTSAVDAVSPSASGAFFPSRDRPRTAARGRIWHVRQAGPAQLSQDGRGAKEVARCAQGH
jgi:hypothetical protein